MGHMALCAYLSPIIIALNNTSYIAPPSLPPPPPLSPSFSSSPILISDSLELLPPHFIVLYDISLKVHILCAPYECSTPHCWAQSHQVILHVCLSRTPLHTSVYLCFVTPPPTNGVSMMMATMSNPMATNMAMNPTVFGKGRSAEL